MDIAVMQNFGIALLLGLIVGMEREFQHQQQKVTDFAGIRTFTLIALFGWLIGYSAHFFGKVVVGVAFAGMLLLVTAAYLGVVWRNKRVGTTSEFSAIIVFLLGMLIAFGHVLVAVVSAIVMTTILSYKYYLHKFVKKLQIQEIHAAIKFGVIALVVLPLLPNKAYSPVDVPILADIVALFPSIQEVLAATQVFNPFKIWLMVVFICAISSIGYISIKIVGAKKGIGLTGAIGGLVSSTAVTSSLAESSKKTTVATAFTFGVIIAWMIMFVRVLFVALVLNKEVFFASLASLGLMAVASAACGVYLYISQSKKEKKTGAVVAFESPFALGPALKFGGFFALVLFLAKLLQGFFGSSGIYIASLLSGLADVDAITISMATLASTGEVSTSVAVTGITLAVASNTLVKAGIAYWFGGKEFGKKVLVCTGIILAVGLLAVLLL